MPAATQTAGVVGAVIVVTGTALVLAAQKFGVFKKVKWEEGPMQEQNIVYVEHKGPYQNIGKAFEKLSKDLEAAGIPVTKNSHTFVGAVCPRAQHRCYAIVVILVLVWCYVESSGIAVFVPVCSFVFEFGPGCL